MDRHARPVAARAALPADRPAPRLAFDADYDDGAGHARPAGTGSTRRSRRWPPTASSPRWCAGWAACAGSRTLTGFALAVEIGDWHRFTGGSIGAYLGLVPTEHSSGASRGPGIDHQDRQQPRPPAAGRGRLASPARATGPARRMRRPLGPGPAGGPRPRSRRATGGCTTAGSAFDARRKTRHRRQRRRSPASWPAGAGRWPSWTDPPPTDVSGRRPGELGGSARSDPRVRYEQPPTGRGHARSLDPRTAPAEHPVLR